MLADLHCHLDLYPDHVTAFEECDRQAVWTLAVTTTPRAWPRNKELATRTCYVHAALGLHPQLAAERAAEVTLWEECLPEAEYIGEVGLDGTPRFRRSLETQKRVFEYVLRACATVGRRIISVHSLRAGTSVLDLIEANLPVDRGRVVLHWFTGSQAEARRAIQLGCYFSINMEMLRSERHRQCVADMPLDRLLTETDGPFTKCEGRPACPADVAATVEALACVRKMETDVVLGALQRNLNALTSFGTD